MTATLFGTFPSLQLMALPSAQYKIFIDEIDNVDYRYEASRLESFKHWPIPYMKPKKLAAAGFYYTGESDIVKCFECHVEIYRWLQNDDPMMDHQRERPMCRFICKIPCGNVPICSDSDNISSDSDDEGYDVTYDFPSEPYCSSFLADVQTRKPKYLQYASHEARRCTFEFWPNSISQTGQQLSDAGFFYTGKEDQVLCYHCGVGVKDWEPNDIPWEQHAIWFPNCDYLLSVKGRDYAKQLANQPPAKDTASYVTNAEQSGNVLTQTVENVCSPGSSSQNSQLADDNGIPSNDSSVTGSITSHDNLPVERNVNLSDNANTENCTPINEARICKICYDSEICQVFVPCGHLIACTKCAYRMKTCPVCRQLVTKTVKVFFS